MDSITLPQVAERLYTCKMPFSLDPEYNWITISFPTEKFWLYFQPTKDDNSLRVFTSTLLDVKDSIYICKILAKMFQVQEKFWALRFGHKEGKIDCYGLLSSLQQIDWVIGDLTCLFVAMPALKAIQATGAELGQEKPVHRVLDDLA